MEPLILICEGCRVRIRAADPATDRSPPAGVPEHPQHPVAHLRHRRLVGDHEEPAPGIAQDRLDVLLQVADDPALMAEERLQQLGDGRGVVGVRDPGRRRRHSATPQCSAAAMASAPAQATRSSTGTYSSTV